MTVAVREPVMEIVLNAAELAIQSVAARDAAGAIVQGTAVLDEAQERARLVFPSPLAPGEWRLSIGFTGTLNDKLHGFYRSTYKDAAGVTHTIAATQFEATDARRAFPCWDEPACKAVFAVTLVVPERLVADLEHRGGQRRSRRRTGARRCASPTPSRCRPTSSPSSSASWRRRRR